MLNTEHRTPNIERPTLNAQRPTPNAQRSKKQLQVRCPLSVVSPLSSACRAVAFGVGGTSDPPKDGLLGAVCRADIPAGVRAFAGAVTVGGVIVIIAGAAAAG